MVDLTRSVKVSVLVGDLVTGDLQQEQKPLVLMNLTRRQYHTLTLHGSTFYLTDWVVVVVVTVSVGVLPSTVTVEVVLLLQV